ncbi:MAG: ATP-binding protein [Polyangiaceae bacterium]
MRGRPVRLALAGDANVVIDADAKRVRQILTNLVGNAVKFTSEGEVSVTVRRHLNYARISIRDTGPGISAADRALIFEDFKQPESERKRRRGSGLGLAIARRLVLMHGGSIQLDSEVGRGSTFEVMLPLHFGKGRP